MSIKAKYNLKPNRHIDVLTKIDEGCAFTLLHERAKLAHGQAVEQVGPLRDHGTVYRDNLSLDLCDKYLQYFLQHQDQVVDPKLLYDLVPYFYLTSGFAALFATLYVSDWFWILPHYLLFSAACIQLGLGVLGRRRRSKEPQAPQDVS